MKNLLLLLFLINVYAVSSQEIIPENLAPLFSTHPTQEIEVSEDQKINHSLYRSYYSKSDSKGIYSFTFKLKNINKYIEFLENNEFDKVYDIYGLGRSNKYHIIVYTTKKNQVIISKNEKEATVYDFSKRPYRILGDKFYGGNTMESLRFATYQSSPFEPYATLNFLPLNEERLLCKVSINGGDWAFSDSIKFSINNGADILTFPLNEVSNDVTRISGDIIASELSTFTINKEDAEKISRADAVMVRIIGEKYFQFDMTKPQKYAIEDFISRF